jgi:hypothetical protein
MEAIKDDKRDYKEQHSVQMDKKTQDVTTSCPAKVFKNYSNVFAEITKSVIGEIDNSESENEQN